ncbi:uncharacterized protein [Prorops nasuta]|uniref:uncharacterized protein n=1 Tax=Prorops nasuta TaxID=863751 RepID=UPI0034CF8751
MPLEYSPQPGGTMQSSLIDMKNLPILPSNNGGEAPVDDSAPNNNLRTQILRPTGNGEVSAVWRQQLPAFMSEAPDIWFLIIEAEFSAAKIRSDDTKYLAVLKALDGGTLRSLTDVLRHPPEKGRYENLKSMILNKLVEPRSKQVDNLLRNPTLGDKKPFQLLREMRDLAKGDIGKDILHQLWLERLPAHIRPHLLTSSNLDLDGVVELADRLLDVFSSSYTVAATSGSTYKEARLEKRLDDMQALILNCMQEIKELRLTQRTFDPGNMKQKHRSRSRTPARKKLCYYHERFGKQAQKCAEPCLLHESFNKQQEN